ncbi:uncharacterized protein [Amphiura filiformis]|uniref:uncharacterized protein isoform X2 n=1 Tax=Amphiura filiformis TaxID=82378 RepID=UPI003B20B786
MPTLEPLDLRKKYSLPGLKRCGHFYVCTGQVQYRTFFTTELAEITANSSKGESGDDIITLTVVFTCSEVGTDAMTVKAASPSSYQYEVTSPYSCLMEPEKNQDQGLSAGSILCIIFSLAVVVYLVGGFIFSSLVQKKSGREAIPNYGFWIEVPGLIKEGATFSTSCVTGKGSRTGYEDATPDTQDGADAFGGGEGGGGSSSSTGKTAYDAI